MRLYDFLAPKNPKAAERAALAIQQAAETLGRRPERGRLIEGSAHELRELIIPFSSGAYVALYRYRDDRVAILAVRHSREAGY